MANTRKLGIKMQYTPDVVVQDLRLKWNYHPGIKTFFASYVNRGTNGGFPMLSYYHLLETWCDNNNCKIEHNWIECPDDATAVLFKLTWT